MVYNAPVKEAILYSREGERVRCRVCPRYCLIGEGKRGWCGTRVNKGGRLYTLIYGLVSSMAVSPVEKKPLFHFYPGSKWISMGTYGCNFRCPGCQNWSISFAPPPRRGIFLPPDEVVRIARRYGCLGVSWTYNEPTIWLEYTIDCARAAKEAGLLTHYVTNGYITEEALDLIGPYLDCYRVDIKAFSREAYRRTAHIEDFSPILRAVKRAKERWGMHVECVTNVTPGFNDDRGQLSGIASWIRDELGREVPWHVTRFIPHHLLKDLHPTPVETLEEARDLGMGSGLCHVYIGNVPGHEGENTRCPGCGLKVIERSGFFVRDYRLVEGRCPNCERPLYGRFPREYGRDYTLWEGYEVGIV